MSHISFPTLQRCEVGRGKWRLPSLSRFIYPMLPARLVLVVMCVCECACGRADASALINEPAIIIYTSCSSSDTLYILTTLSSPLSDRCLLSWTFGVPVFSPVRVRVGCAFQIRHGTSGALWIRHGTSELLFTALIWPSKSLRYYPGSVNLHLSSSLEV